MAAKQDVQAVEKKAEAAAKTASAEAREPPVVKPANVVVNDAGQVWRSVLVRMPEGAVADDLRDPKIWRVVQAVPAAALIKMDRLLVLAFDESWAAEALVKHASNSEVKLLIQKVFGFAEAKDGLFSDGTLEVFWNGASYGLRRVSDKLPVAQGFHTEGLAIDELRRYYPRRVSR
jgi:hypothetical protein